MDEQSLIQNCLKGDSIAQRKLFEKFAPKMLAVSLRYMKSQEEAEDVLQEGFIKVFTKLKDYNSIGSLEGWVRRIIVNSALDQIRKNQKFIKDTPLDEVSFKLDNNYSILEELNANSLIELIQKIPSGYRTIFNLFAIEGYSHKEIGDLLGISENTSKSQYSRARAYLKQELEKLDIGREG